MALNKTPESAVQMSSVDAGKGNVVFQPPKLTEVVEMIDLIGSFSDRVREDSSSDMGSAGAMVSSGGAQQGSGQSARDQAIANLPTTYVMQQKLVSHLRKEITKLEKEAHRMARSAARGAAYALTEFYKKIRRLSALIDEILQASAEMIQRFYISVFIDRQPLVVTGGSLVQSA